MSLQDTYPCECGERVDRTNNYCPHCGTEIEIDWPLEFTLSATNDAASGEKVEMAGLPHSDRICDALLYFPGEVVLHARLSEELNTEVVEIEVGEQTFTPEGDSE